MNKITNELMINLKKSLPVRIGNYQLTIWDREQIAKFEGEVDVDSLGNGKFIEYSVCYFDKDFESMNGQIAYIYSDGTIDVYGICRDFYDVEKEEFYEIIKCF